MRSSTRAIAASMFGCERRLHAALHDQHLCARAAAPATRRRRAPSGMRSRELARQPALGDAPDGERRAEQRPRQQRPCAAPSAARPRRGVRPTLSLDDRAADVDQPTVLDAGRTRGLAVAAREAAVEMQLRLRRERVAFEHLLDQIDAAARPVELVAEQLVGRARRVAEAAMHARAQDRVGLAALAACREFRARARFPSECRRTSGRG